MGIDTSSAHVVIRTTVRGASNLRGCVRDTDLVDVCLQVRVYFNTLGGVWHSTSEPFLRTGALNYISWGVGAKEVQKYICFIWGPNEHLFLKFSFIFLCIPEVIEIRALTELVGRLDLACGPPFENPCLRRYYGCPHWNVRSRDQCSL